MDTGVVALVNPCPKTCTPPTNHNKAQQNPVHIFWYAVRNSFVDCDIYLLSAVLYWTLHMLPTPITNVSFQEGMLTVTVLLTACLGYFLVSQTWWRHYMETLPALLDPQKCKRNLSVTSGFSSHRASIVKLCYYIRFILNNVLKNQSTYWWFKTPMLTSQMPAPCIGDPAFDINVFTYVVAISNQRRDF